MKRISPYLPALAVAGAVFLLVPAVAMAAPTAGAIFDSLSLQGGKLSKLVGIAAFIIGVGLAIAGILKFKAHSQNPNDPSAKMSTAFVLIFAGAALVAIPTMLGSGVATIFGTGADTTDAQNGFDSL
ncbi:hypothetical protein LAZ40_11560 [Cereibacter sphaeroides]|uniref:hypothetical protein n=1 Tax=Cereibacter sphaeroides TaxID=1063 RepID=UPI001F44C9C5|nr:hypothetical protein [Cereibacter sphaeroides]MCE6959655.1 hypothetical protein [Cereibacter sphaeroides]MCE6974484.1 hypothetical protein [Cereibacter sphaeroides]